MFVKVQLKRGECQLNSQNKWICCYSACCDYSSEQHSVNIVLHVPARLTLGFFVRCLRSSCKNPLKIVCPEMVIWHTMENTSDSKGNKPFKFYHPRGRCLSQKHRASSMHHLPGSLVLVLENWISRNTQAFLSNIILI